MPTFFISEREHITMSGVSISLHSSLLPTTTTLMPSFQILLVRQLWGDLRAFLKKKGALKQTAAVKFALDIARYPLRGMNYLHEHKPEAIIHRDLEPPYQDYRNILRDDTGHLKVADFGVSKLLKVANTVKEDKPVSCIDTSGKSTAFVKKSFIFCLLTYSWKHALFFPSLLVV
ncbi:hypothetical protein GIB67_032181 [Kingdonia uniflora]|uniref:Protein kinase domain-containing protein n=1 Tax=Kingdonia uniflora TaxID=39325 RepID=A0A7J7MXA1_9MAGN|nr:hypothetical protein GIB67_032181 [Kingdonia uniflora]